MINRFIPTALLSVLVLSGCSLIPKYERPLAPVPESFAAAYGQTATPATSNQAAADIPWRTFFTDPALQQLIEAALVNNRDLRVAALNIEQARAQFRIRQANQYPTVGAGVNASRANSAVNGDLVNSFNAGLALSSWEIDFFGRLGSLKEQAFAQYLATDEGRKAAQIGLVASVANGWLNLLADEDSLEISRRTLQTREESVKLTKLRFDSGVASALDYSQARSLTEAARATYAQQQRQRALDENALALLLGQAVPADLLAQTKQRRLDKDTVLATADIPVGLPSDLLNRRPDIRQAEQQLIGANANIGAARAAFFPNISLTAQAGTASNELSGLFKSGSWGFSIAPSLLLPIFDAGRNRANLDVAKVGRDIAVAQYEKSIQTAFREVSDALASQSTLADQLRAQEAQAQADSENFSLSDLRYRNGVSSYLDLLEAQRSLFASQLAMVQLRLAEAQNKVSLYKALGGGWTDAPATTASVTQQ